MPRKKRYKRISIKKVRNQRTVFVESIVSAKETLFPEKLKRANEILAKIDLTDFIDNPHKYRFPNTSSEQSAKSPVMIRKKKIKKRSVKELVPKNTVIVVKSIVPSEDTLFPEKLKRANEVLKNLDLSDF
ncbi:MULTISPECIES: hypothetical protein [Niastella]|uniref:Uncharacterized protein n=1 Tax=Niastella soli TaxID=2821487 RepID=A0ABS3YPB1_9BACT|nr:hypothetical protein [Niastella soli]MBO9199724.1 hypothetical protein [Niastella soli]